MAQSHPSIYELLGFFMQGDLGGFTAYTSMRNKVVWFVKSPPLEPASPRQLQLRNAFRTNAYVWQNMTEDQRATWNDAARLAPLRIHGYNLFTHWMRYRDNATVNTVERISGVTIYFPEVGI